MNVRARLGQSIMEPIASARMVTKETVPIVQILTNVPPRPIIVMAMQLVRTRQEISRAIVTVVSREMVQNAMTSMSVSRVHVMQMRIVRILSAHTRAIAIQDTMEMVLIVTMWMSAPMSVSINVTITLHAQI